MAVIGIDGEIIGVSGCHGMVDGLCGFRAGDNGSGEFVDVVVVEVMSRVQMDSSPLTRDHENWGRDLRKKYFWSTYRRNCLKVSLFQDSRDINKTLQVLVKHLDFKII